MPLPDRDAFLRETRLGILTTMTASGAPISVPVWYEWDGERARIFTTKTSTKMKRLRRDPRASLLVTNAVGEQEYWVAIDASVSVHPEGAIELAEALAARYWDMDDPERAAAVQKWRDESARLVVLELTPTKIRTYS